MQNIDVTPPEICRMDTKNDALEHVSPASNMASLRYLWVDLVQLVKKPANRQPTKN